MQTRSFYRPDSIGDGSFLIWSTPHCQLEQSGIRSSTMDIPVLLCMYTMFIDIANLAGEQATETSLHHSGQEPTSYPLHCLEQRSTIAGH